MSLILSCVSPLPVPFAKLGSSNFLNLYYFFHVFNETVFLGFLFCFSQRNLYSRNIKAITGAARGCSWRETDLSHQRK